jgi:hypothetical protein
VPGRSNTRSQSARSVSTSSALERSSNTSSSGSRTNWGCGLRGMASLY